MTVCLKTIKSHTVHLRKLLTLLSVVGGTLKLKMFSLLAENTSYLCHFIQIGPLENIGGEYSSCTWAEGPHESDETKLLPQSSKRISPFCSNLINSGNTAEQEISKRSAHIMFLVNYGRNRSCRKSVGTTVDSTDTSIFTFSEEIHCEQRHMPFWSRVCIFISRRERHLPNYWILYVPVHQWWIGALNYAQGMQGCNMRTVFTMTILKTQPVLPTKRLRRSRMVSDFRQCVGKIRKMVIESSPVRLQSSSPKW